MPVFEQPWNIHFDIPQEVIDRTPRDTLKTTLQNFISQGATTELNRIIDEWLDTYKGKEEALPDVASKAFESILVELPVSPEDEDAGTD